MAFKLARMREVVSELLKSSNTLDEFTFIQTADLPVALSGFIGPLMPCKRSPSFNPKGAPRLDGVYLGSQLIKTARISRQVLLVISDGEDNASRYTETDTRNALIQAGVRVYTI